jgi:hypothetical protein
MLEMEPEQRCLLYKAESIVRVDIFLQEIEETKAAKDRDGSGDSAKSSIRICVPSSWSLLPATLTVFHARPFLQLPTPCPMCETSCSRLYALVCQAGGLYLEQAHWRAPE